MLDFTCPTHGEFEVMADKREDNVRHQPCPSVDPDGKSTCERMSPVVDSYAVRGRLKLGEVSRGKNDQPLPPHILSTEALADGMPMSEWKGIQKKKRIEERWADNRASIA
jgi:hypothetical protein